MRNRPSYSFFTFLFSLKRFFAVFLLTILMGTAVLEVNLARAQMVPVTDIESQFILVEGFQEQALLLGSIDVSNALIAEASVQLELKETILDGIVFAALNMVIQEISDSLVQWIQSGFKGSPGFIQNPEQFFLEVGDQVLGEFIASSDLGFLCNPFGIDFRLALNLSFATGRFRQRHGCTLTQVVTNVQNGFDDLSQNGWDGWISMTATPSNNPYGAFMAAESEAAFRIANKSIIESDKLSWGNGFLSWEDDYGNIQTPGTVVENQINDALDSGKRRLEVADEISEIIGALMGQLLSMTTKGLASVTQRGNGRTGAQIAFDESLTVTRNGGGPQGQPLVGPPPPPPWQVPTSTRPTTTPNTPPPGPNPNPPNGPPTNTIIGVNLNNAEVRGSLDGVNVTNMIFTPGGNGLKLEAGPAAPDLITTTGFNNGVAASIKALGGNIYLCPTGQISPSGGCNVIPFAVTNIGTAAPGGIDIDILSGRDAPMQTTSGIVTADSGIGRSTGGSANNVDATGGTTFNTTSPNITDASIINAQVVGNVTSTNLTGGRITGTLNVASVRAHLSANTTYSSNTSAPLVYRAGTTINISHLDSASINGGVVTSNTDINGTNIQGYRVVSGSLTNIRGVANLVASGGHIYSGETTGEATVVSNGGISGILINQGNIVGLTPP